MIVSMAQHHSSPERETALVRLIYIHRDEDGVDRRRQGMEIREASR